MAIVSRYPASPPRPTGSRVLRIRAVPSALSRPGEPATSTSSRHHWNGRHSSGSITRTACTRWAGMVSATVPSRPRRIRMPSGDCATVKPYWVDARRHTSDRQTRSSHTSETARAARAAADTNASTAPASTTISAAGPAVDSATEPISLPVGTVTATCSGGSGVAGSRPWWVASRCALSSSAACSVR
jgi:hypothetical protein